MRLRMRLVFPFFAFLRDLHVVLHDDCTSLHSHQLNFVIFAVTACVRQYSAASLCVFLADWWLERLFTFLLIVWSSLLCVACLDSLPFLLDSFCPFLY